MKHLPKLAIAFLTGLFCLPSIAQAAAADLTIVNNNKTEITVKIYTADDTTLCMRRDIPKFTTDRWDLSTSACAAEKLYVAHAYGAIIKTGEGKVCSVKKGGTITVTHATPSIAISCS